MQIVALLIAFLSVSFYPPTKTAETPSKSGIEFFKGTWEEVKAEAKAQNKLIFVDAYAVWCGPCKWMDKNVFTLPSVGEYFNEHFINYKFDMEKGEGRSWAVKYRITAYPTFIFTNEEGQEVHRSLGAKQSQQFINLGISAVAAAGR